MRAETARGVGVVPGASHQRRRRSDHDRLNRAFSSRQASTKPGAVERVDPPPQSALTLRSCDVSDRNVLADTSSHALQPGRQPYLSSPLSLSLSLSLYLSLCLSLCLSLSLSPSLYPLCTVRGCSWWLLVDVQVLWLARGSDGKNGAYAEPREPDRSRNKRTLDGRRRGVTSFEWQSSVTLDRRGRRYGGCP